MQQAYGYEITGTAANGQTWTSKGFVDASEKITDALDAAMAASFKDITKGRAVFGKPGVGCAGPYDISKIVLEKIG